MRVAEPTLSIVVAPGYPSGDEADHLDVEDSVGYRVDPSVRVGSRWVRSDVVDDFPRVAMVARAHDFLEGDEEHAAARGYADARLGAVLTDVAEGEVHRQHRQVEDLAVGTCYEPAVWWRWFLGWRWRCIVAEDAA